MFEDGKRNLVRTNGKEFSVCRLFWLNTIANLISKILEIKLESLKIIVSNSNYNLFKC